MIFLPSLLQHSPLITEDNANQEKKEQRGIINKMKSQKCTVQAYLWISRFVCVGLEGPVGKNSVAFKSWRSLEKNTEGKKERGGGERKGKMGKQ